MTAFKRLCILGLVLLIAVLVAPLSPSAYAQDDEGEDDPAIETTRTARDQPDDEETDDSDQDETGDESTDIDIDSSDDTESTSPNVAAIEVDDIYQTIAQGLAAFDAFPDGIWRITELEPKSADEAPSVTAPYYGFLYQMDGTTIVRNDTTGKRARLEPGEAYYFSANDTYTRYREEDASRAWLIEVVPEGADPADAAGTPIFHSDPIGSFPDDTRDLELISGNLMDGESSTLPDFEVDVLVMAPLGRIEVEDDDGTTTMKPPAALLVSSGATLTNTGDEPTVYIVAKVGPSVGDSAPTAAEEDDSTDADEADSGDETADEVDETLIDTDADGLTDADEAVYGTDPEIADTDFDGYADGDEVLIYGTDPLDSNSWP